MRLRNIIIIPLIFLCVSVTAQRIKGYYVSKNNDKGVTYYLFPQRLFENDKHGNLEYDITVLTGADSTVTLNFTYLSDRAQKIDSVRIKSSVMDYCRPVKRIYIEPSKSEKWVHRYSLATNLSSIQKVYSQDTYPTITIYSEGEAVVFNTLSRKWDRYRPIGARILDMIKVNN